jgi:hypothetical protein
MFTSLFSQTSIEQRVAQGYCSIIHNSQATEIAKVLYKWWID